MLRVFRTSHCHQSKFIGGDQRPIFRKRDVAEHLYVSDVSTADRVDDPKPADTAQNAWGDSPWLAFGVRTIVFLVPILLSLAVTWILASSWPAPTNVPGALARFGVLAVIAIAVAHFADKGARKFLPLAALFRLSLVFPDQAPSRFAIALRSGNTKRLEQRLAQAQAGEFTGSQADAAQLVVELAALLSEHDRLTRGHSERVRAFTALIAEEMNLSAEDSNKLQWAGLIHDVGKLRIDDRILTKPGKLTAEEFEIIKTHPAEGMRLAEPLADYLGEWMGAIGEHHERYDGGGYPLGLAGEQISLAGRIVAVADAYDVITAARSYKKPLPPEFARQELADNAGSQFDPDVVRAFMSISLGRLRRAMWPLSWAAQLPFLGTAVTTPIAQTVAATVVTLATATGVTVATDGFEAFQEVPDAIALVDQAAETVEQAPLEDAVVVASTTTGATVAPAALPTSPSTSTTTVAADTTTEAPTPTAPTTSTTNQLVTTTTDKPVVTTTTIKKQFPTTTTNKPVATTTTIKKQFPTTTTKKPVVTTTTTTTTSTTTTTTTTAKPSDCALARSGDGEQQGANLRNCDLSGVVFTDANFSNADVRGAKLIGTKFNGGLFAGADFGGATIDDASFSSADFAGAKFSNATITNTGFYGVNLTGARFVDARLTDVGLNAGLTNANFTRAKLVRVGLEGATLQGTTFAGAEVKNSNFNYAKLAGATLGDVALTDVEFWEATGTPAVASTAQFTNVKCPDGLFANVSCW